MNLEHGENLFQKLINKIKAHLIADVPIEIDACEECRVTKCSHDKLVHCENRIRREKQLKADRKGYRS